MELREFLFQPLEGRSFRLAIRAREGGILSGVPALAERAAEIGLEEISVLPEGSPLAAGTRVLAARGRAEKVARAEEMLLGTIGKTSGVATAAAAMVARAGPVRVVCGAWKKVSPALGVELRQAIVTGGAGIRISDQPFVYLDKNYVRMLGSVGRAVDRAKSFDPERLVVVQLRGEGQPIVAEAAAAVAGGAAIVMIDTGRLEDLRAVARAADGDGWRSKAQLAFGGGVTPGNVAEVAAAGADIADVGRAIIDAPLLDFSLDVEE
ncbi:MAG: nicotinate-nucleotide pyrophosphorylase [Chloroflexi bacterium]|nr:nicotinate-nucleotide pyrophosphorylase [Chloroflexota bacterium]